ncbi:Ubiquitin-conjugating_enzyme E2 [Hexamita inflata]|uniref:Ubiquitin-conjugating enzyme E2 n=1 Tax=Hexamita inflata TaxID=28002 RepID=A0AA86TUV9_9EUKA|nr:Ubiquitin-conjugating enzyme E2 [Hexamita inflata]
MVDNPKVIIRQLEHAKQLNDPNVKLYVTKAGMLNEIHFSVRGPMETVFQGGWYHGTLLLPREYPYKPPHVRICTRSGRFETNTNLCFSFTAFHPESWSPAVNLSAIVIALQSLFDDFDERAVGMISHVDFAEVKKLAKCSMLYKCDQCGADHSKIQ